MPGRSLDISDLIAPDAYLAIRKRRRREMSAHMRVREMRVGPSVAFHFESRETVWTQIQELLAIERAGPDQSDPEQAAAELAAFGPLAPGGRNLIASVLFEIGDPEGRNALLASLKGVESHLFIEVDGVVVRGAPVAESAEAASESAAFGFLFVRFDLSDAAAQALKSGGRVCVGVDHPNYGHVAPMPPATQSALADDLD